MTPVNIGIAVAIVLLIGLLVKLRRGRRRRDDDGFSPPAVAEASGPMAAGASWVVGGSSPQQPVAAGVVADDAGASWLGADDPDPAPAALFAAPAASVASADGDLAAAGADDERTLVAVREAIGGGWSAPTSTDPPATGPSEAPMDAREWGGTLNGTGAIDWAAPAPAHGEPLWKAWEDAAAVPAMAPADPTPVLAPAGGSPAGEAVPSASPVAEAAPSWGAWAPSAAEGTSVAEPLDGSVGFVALATAELSATAVEEPPVVEPAAAAPDAATLGLLWSAGSCDAVPASASSEPVANGAEEALAWWDLEVAAPAADAGASDGVVPNRGRFAVGGHALFPGDPALAGVTFRRPAASAPARWCHGPAPDAAPGTLVITVAGARNVNAGSVDVVMDDGFAPDADGFVVRAAAAEIGPFMVSGTFEVRGD